MERLRLHRMDQRSQLATVLTMANVGPTIVVSSAIPQGDLIGEIHSPLQTAGTPILNVGFFDLYGSRPAPSHLMADSPFRGQKHSLQTRRLAGREDKYGDLVYISSGNRSDLGRYAGHADGPSKLRKVSFSRSAGQHLQ